MSSSACTRRVVTGTVLPPGGDRQDHHAPVAPCAHPAAPHYALHDVIHRFNEIGMACLDPQWAGGRPRLTSPDEEEFIAQTATTRPTNLGQPFTRWSIANCSTTCIACPAAPSPSAGKP